MEREDIERSDFATVRRGYDPAAVDAHLREVAAAVEQLEDRVEELSARPETLSQAANERLRRILEAAESSAAEVTDEAGEQARSLIADAQREAQTMTEQAERRARERDAETETTSAERLSRVDRRTAELMARADALDEEFDRLLERMRGAAVAAVGTLRGDAEGLRQELDEMPGESVRANGEADRGEDSDELEPPTLVDPTVEAEPLGGELGADQGEGRTLDDGPIEPEPVGREDNDLLEPEPEVEPLGDEVIPEPRGAERLPEPPEEPLSDPDEEALVDPDEEPDFEPGSDTLAEEDEPTERRPSGGADDSDQDMEGARLIALNMALSGSSRAETAEYLRETFGFEDQALLDDVYDRVQAP